LGLWPEEVEVLLRNENLFLNDFFRIRGLKGIRGFNEKFSFNARSFGIFFRNSVYLKELLLDGFCGWRILKNPYFAKSNGLPCFIWSGVEFGDGSGIFRFIYGVGKSIANP